MLFHQLGQDLILLLNPFFQFLDPTLLFGLVLLTALGCLLKSCRSVLKKLPQPSMKYRRLQIELLADVRHGAFFHQMPSQNRYFFLGSVILPCFLQNVLRCVYLNGGSLHFRLRQDTTPSTQCRTPRAEFRASSPESNPPTFSFNHL